MAAMGLNYKYYQRLELGQVNPTLLTLYKVAAALEVSVYELFWPESDHTPDTTLAPIGEANVRQMPLTRRL
jgi:transcriptional regulator with XRE-family HTH domain